MSSISLIFGIFERDIIMDVDDRQRILLGESLDYGIDLIDFRICDSRFRLRILQSAQYQLDRGYLSFYLGEIIFEFVRESF